MIKAIFFDYDGVLVESVDIKTNAFGRLFESEGEDVVKRVVSYHLDNTGVSRFEKLRYIYKEILSQQLKEEVFQDLCRRFSKLVVDEVVKAPYVIGAREFLENYAQEYRCFIVSATPHEEIEQIIIRRNLKKHFAGIYGAPQKKADIVKKTIVIDGLMPKQAVYIGDALSDYKAANTNSVNFIARINNNNEDIFDGISCIKLENLIELRNILESNF